VRNTHIYCGVLFSIVSLWCLIWFIPGNTIPAQSELDLSPALVPSISVAAILVTSIMMLIHALREERDDSGGSALDDEFGLEAVGINPQVMSNTLIWAVLATVCWNIMDDVGFEPAMTLLLLLTMYFVGERRWWVIISTSVITPILLSQMAFLFFTTQLPAVWR
jgi:hypothetical protein